MSNVPRSLLSLDHTNAARSTQGATFTLSVIKEGDASATRCARPIRGGRTCDVVLSLLSCRSAKDCRPARWAHDGLNQHVVGSAWRLGGSRDRATAVRSAARRTDGRCFLHTLSAGTGAGRRAERASMAAVSSQTLAAGEKRRCEHFTPCPPWQRGACPRIVIREGGWECRAHRMTKFMRGLVEVCVSCH